MSAKKPLGDLSDPQGLAAMALVFLEAQRALNMTEQTLSTWRKQLRPFIAWCEERSIMRPDGVTRELVERYQRHLAQQVKTNGQPLSPATQHARLSALKAYFKWLSKTHRIPWNPASELELPNLGRRLPRNVLIAEEAEKVMLQPDVATPLGLRDRGILETFYSTGMRRMELAQLQLGDVDATRAVVLIREGKGRKDRVVPIGARALSWVGKYVADARPQLVTGPEEQALFISRQGGAFTIHALSELVGSYVKAAQLGKAGACHLLRHTMATLMLENGADIRFIQELLGHASLETTQIYTRVSIAKLKAIHTATHPAATLEGPGHAGVVPELVEGEEELSKEALLEALIQADQEEPEE